MPKDVEKRGDDILNVTKKIIMIIVALILVCVIGILIIASPWIITSIGIWLSPNPTKPEITYGEFPFRLEYRIDDDIFVVEDVIICEYDGIKCDIDSGKYRAWKKTFKNTSEEKLLILTDGDTKIYCNLGSGGYYMGDLTHFANEPHTPEFYSITSYDDVDISLSGNDKELMEQYNIELIDWQFSKPIENKFE